MSDSATEVDNNSESSHLEDIFNTYMGDPESSDAEAEQGLGENVDGENASEEGTTEEPQETNSEMSELRELIENLTKQGKNAQELISRQGNELGQLRKSAEKPMPTNDEFLDKFADNPTEALQAEMDRRDADRDNRAADEANRVSQNRADILQLVPDFDSQINGIKEWYKGKGATDQFVQSISQDSLAGNVDLAVALGEIQTLNKQLAETKSQNSNVINKLNKGGTVLSGRSGASAGTDSTIQVPSNVTKLSDKQLKAMMRQLQSA